MPATPLNTTNKAILFFIEDYPNNREIYDALVDPKQYSNMPPQIVNIYKYFIGNHKENFTKILLSRIKPENN